MDRRAFLRRTGAAVAALAAGPRWAQSSRPRPTAAQLAWQRDELALFLHFGINTFTDREWGDGREDPGIFAPAALDARAWAKTARAAGFRALILTAKHHDGFCLWPTRTTRHSIAKSPWRSGTGDLVREFVEACRIEGLGAGLYLSPWDRNHPAYGVSARLRDFPSTAKRLPAGASSLAAEPSATRASSVSTRSQRGPFASSSKRRSPRSRCRPSGSSGPSSGRGHLHRVVHHRSSPSCCRVRSVPSVIDAAAAELDAEYAAPALWTYTSLPPGER